MTTYGYARTSTLDQVAGFEDQVAKLQAAGCDTIFKEQVSATDIDSRKQWAMLLDSVKPGDTIAVTKIDRAARSIKHMVEITSTLNDKGAAIRILDMNIDTSTPTGALMLNIFSSVAQFERDQMLERQKIGIAKAKAEGRYKGRAPTAQAKAGKVVELASKGLTKQEIADATGMGVASVYRILSDAKEAA